ncbi:integrin-linked protein kinase 1 isoform X2 [Cryptomeria japonica]|uniref:integrin-linked protein kinase 1 isoform X2 n=1 Tax=Cryptomeria japonica TaxID=3369 RepID=UPI0027DA60AF|nr:integrin-linked protein kinase 1 isoform X2 [Cryptomeria japonica]
MEVARKVSRQWSLGSRQWSLGSRQATLSGKWKLSFGRQSSLDPNKKNGTVDVDLCVPEQLDATMQMLFLTCRGDAEGVEALLDHHHPPLDVNSADFDDRTALHVAACQGHAHLVHLLISRGANVNARDRWGSTPLADAKYYGNTEICNILKSNGAKSPKTPMSVANPQHVPEYELNPVELSFPRNADTSKDSYQLAKWNGTKVAVKILDKHYCSDSESMKSFCNELTLLQKIRHPNVVQFIGAVTQNVPMMIIAEYLPNGDLSSYLKKKGRLQPVKAVRFALEIARGMNYLHECKPGAIIHCDLKPKNILRDSGGHLKVTDFGLGKLLKVSSDKVKESHIRPLNDTSRLYMAPEVYKNEDFDRSVDVFSFCLILYEMIEGTAPFHPNLPEEASRMMALEDKRPPFKLKSKNCPGELKELIQECWDRNPLVRPTFAEIIVRLEKIKPLCEKHKFWSGAFKFPSI